MMKTQPQASTERAPFIVSEETGKGFLSFPVPLSDRRLFLIGLDLIALSSAFLLSLELAPGLGPDLRVLAGSPLSFVWIIPMILLWIPLAFVSHAYELTTAGRLSTAVACVLKAGLANSIVYLIVLFLIPIPSLWRQGLAPFPALALALLLIGRGIYVFTLAQPIFQRRVLIIGAGWAGRTIAQVIREDGHSTYDISGFIDSDPNKHGRRIVGLRVLGGAQDLHRVVQKHGVSELILAITHEIHPDLFQALLTCQEQGILVTPMSVLYENLKGQVPVEHIGRNWYVALPLDHPQTRLGNAIVKRVADLLVAVVGLVLFLLLLPLLALLIRLDSTGPVFYWQERVGRRGRVFPLVKLRTMVEDAEPDGQAVWAQESDPRVTRLGRFLRLTMLDEVPQLWNVLKGEMSFVGPRPERPELVAELECKIPFYRLRHTVKPGMAGWALIHHGYGRSVEDSLFKLQYDLYYIKHQSAWLDFLIVLRTIGRALSLRRGELKSRRLTIR